jgi:5'-3' exonuclease
VIVGWDTLDQPTYRHKALPDYQAGRTFDEELLEQLAILAALAELNAELERQSGRRSRHWKAEL